MDEIRKPYKTPLLKIFGNVSLLTQRRGTYHAERYQDGRYDDGYPTVDQGSSDNVHRIN